jgi:hypothetical protein
LRAERRERPPSGTDTLHPAHHRSEFANRVRPFFRSSCGTLLT